MQEALQYYIRRLTNLTGRSATLRLLRLSAGRFLDVHALDHCLGVPSFAIIEGLLAAKGRIPLASHIDQGDPESNMLTLRLRQLQRNEHFLYQERGARDLYIGWPFVEGKFNDGRLLRAPLLLFPVQLQMEKNQWCLQIDKDSPPIFNRAFLLAYFLHNQLPFSADVQSQFVLPELPAEPLPFLTALYRMIEDSVLELSFNSAQFEQRLEPFRSYKKEDLQRRTSTGRLRLFPQAVLGLFSQGSSVLIDDYTRWLAMELPPKAEDLLPEQVSTKVAEGALNADPCAPLLMDGAQGAALAKIKQGYSLVVQGPPGTGKSQLITNLICDYLAQDKQVLLVCQKRAALDVVRARLAHLGLSDYVLQVCDVRNDRKALYAQLGAHIEQLSRLQPSWEEGPLRQRLKVLGKALGGASQQWEALRVALYDSNACGLPIKNLYLEANSQAEVLQNKAQCLQFSASDLPDLERKYKRYAQYKVRFSDTHPWADRRSFALYEADKLPVLQNCLQRAAQELADFHTQSQRYFTGAPTLKQLRSLFKYEADLEQLRAAAPPPSKQNGWQLQLSKEETDKAQKQLHEVQKQLYRLFQAPMPDRFLAEEVRRQLQPQLKGWIRMRKQRLRWFFFKHFHKGYAMLLKACRTLHLEDNIKGLQVLEQRIQKSIQLQQLHKALQQKSWVHDLPEALAEASHWQAWLPKQREALQLWAAYRATPLPSLGFRYEENTFIEPFGALLRWIKQLKGLSQAIDPYLSTAQQARLSEDPKHSEALHSSLFSDFEDLCAFDRLEKELPSAHKALLYELQAYTKTWDAEKLWALFLNSWRLAWITQIEQKHPILRQVCTEAFFEEEQQLLNQQIEKEHISAKWLQLHLAQRAAAPYFSSPPPRKAPYAQLRYQLGKRRHIWPLRKLLAQFYEPLSVLSPCWLASPEAVSALFPLEKCFDLVLFDEASQCFIENGLPALYRARQTVIVGDKAQLQPNDLYMGRWEEDTEETNPSEDTLFPQAAISLLDWAATTLPQMTLQGHYRSQSPELIDFSNQHFYQDKLSLIPDYALIKNYKPVIHYHKVSGHWKEQRNPTEATHIIQLLAQLFKDQPQKQVGVVTFNYPQQELLLQEIDTYRSANPAAPPEPWEHLFVKNIENVQGDERDIIIFSIGYAPHPDQKQIQHFFGTLNMEGGENRLNVAITRAREALYIVSSIWPEELHVEKLRGQGPKLLKSYLQYARKVSEGGYHPRALAAQVPSHTLRLRDKLLKTTPQQQLRSDAVAFADLSYHPNGTLSGLLYTDDDIYYSFPAAQAFHLHRPRLLKAKGWHYTDLYSRAYWLNPNILRQHLAAMTQNTTPQPPKTIT